MEFLTHSVSNSQQFSSHSSSNIFLSHTYRPIEKLLFPFQEASCLRKQGLVDIDYIFFLGILEAFHVCDEVILFLDCPGTADACWGGWEWNVLCAIALGSGAAQVSPGQEATLGSTGHGRIGSAGALPPHLLWEMALGAVKSSGERMLSPCQAQTQGWLGLAFSPLSVCGFRCRNEHQSSVQRGILLCPRAETAQGMAQKRESTDCAGT